MIYFVQAGVDRGPIKIGYVAHPSAMHGRLAILQVGNAERLYVAASMPGELAEERRLHERFAAGRIGGEWFRWDTPGLQELIYGAVEAEASILTDRRVRYCAWCKTNLVQPPRTKVCSDDCEREKKRAASRAWKAARR